MAKITFYVNLGDLEPALSDRKLSMKELQKEETGIAEEALIVGVDKKVQVAIISNATAKKAKNSFNNFK